MCFENLADSDRLMLPIRTSLFSQPVIEARVPNHDGASDDEENGDNYHEEQALPGYIVISSDDDEDESERTSKRKAKQLLEQLTQEELSFRESLHHPSSSSVSSSQNTYITNGKNQTNITTPEPDKGLDKPLGRCVLHMDNASPHNAESVRRLLASSSFLRMCHPPNSPDLAPSDFWLFSYLKKHLEYQKTKDKESLLQVLRTILDGIPSEMWQKVFLDWERRLEWVIANGGAYYPAHLKDAKSHSPDVNPPLQTPQKVFRRSVAEDINLTPQNQESALPPTPNSEPQTPRIPVIKPVQPNRSPTHGESLQMGTYSVLFPNLGNTCYINSLLQCLLHISHFSSFFLTETMKLNRGTVKERLSIIPSLESVFQQIRSSLVSGTTGLPEINLQDFVKTVSALHPDFRLGSQADQHQLFQLIIEAIV